MAGGDLGPGLGPGLRGGLLALAVGVAPVAAAAQDGGEELDWLIGGAPSEPQAEREGSADGSKETGNAEEPVDPVDVITLPRKPPAPAPQPRRSGVLEEVIVTAQKREQNLQDVPMAVTAISAELIESNEINSVEDLTRLVPSLRFSSDANINSAINIRGIGTNVYSIAVEPNVSMMVDGVVLARASQASFDFSDIQRIEVLRGPQGTLFGKNASAGLVHVITSEPASELEASARFSFEQPETYPGHFAKLQANVSGPLTPELGWRLTGFAKEAGGHLDDVEQNSHAPDLRQLGARGKLRWDPSDALILRLSLEYQRRDGETGLITFRDGNPDLRERSAPIVFGERNRQAKSNGTNLADAESYAAALTADWNIGDFTLTSVTAFRKADHDDNITVVGIDGQRVDLTLNYSDIGLETFTQELRLTSPGGGALEYTTGLLWFDNTVTEDYDRFIEDIPAAIIANSVIPGRLIPSGFGDQLGGADAVNTYDTRDAVVETGNLGIFAEGTWHISDTWHLTAGARFIDEKTGVRLATTSRLSDAATDQTLQSSEFTSPGTVSVTDSTVTGKLALSHDWRDNITVFALFATGYRGATFDLASADPAEALANPVQPERATSYELGIKSRLFDDRLELNGGVFLTYFRDFQAQIRDLQNAGSIVAHRLDNAGELQTSGVELEFHARPTDPLSIVGALVYVRAVYNEFVTQCFAGQGPDEAGAIDSDGDGVCDAQDVSGGVLANAPEFSGSLTARYDHLLTAAGSTLYGQISGRWQTEVQFTNEQQPTTIDDGYSVWDLRIGWLAADTRFEVAGYVKNLFRQNYADNLTPLSLVNDRRDVVHKLSMGTDRLYGLSLAYRW